MCTKARLVQADNVSNWFGMTHDGPADVPNVKLLSGQSAYLEVQIDPAAHGERGLGAIERGVAVTTAGGQRLEFVLKAVVVK